MLGLLGVYFFDLPKQIGIFTISSAVAVPLGLIALMILRNIRTWSTPSTWIAFGVAAITAIVWAIRAVSGLLQGPPTVLVEATPVPIASAVIGAIFTVAMSTNFFSLVNAKHQREIVANLRRDPHVPI